MPSMLEALPDETPAPRSDFFAGWSPMGGFEKSRYLGLAAGLALALTGLSARTLPADPFTPGGPASLVEVKLGSLEVVGRDSNGRVVRESGVNKGDKVLRTTLRDASGAITEQVTKIISSLPGKHPLYVRTDDFTKRGDLKSTQKEFYTLDGSGTQLRGRRETKNLKNGRVVKEEKEAWSPEIDGWLLTSYATLSYYLDGDKRERITVCPSKGTKSDETWGPKGNRGRPKTLRLWDASIGGWGPPR